MSSADIAGYSLTRGDAVETLIVLVVKDRGSSPLFLYRFKDDSMAANLMLIYKLKPSVSPGDFENWVRTTDYPAMRGLKRVSQFTTYRATGLLMGDGPPSMDYIEVFEIADFAGFTQEDLGSPTVQSIMGQFMGFAEMPQFVLVNEVK